MKNNTDTHEETHILDVKINLLEIAIYCILIAAVLWAFSLLVGCSAVKDYVTTQRPTVEAVSVDEVDHALLKWKYGGFNGANAVLDTPLLAGLTCDGRKLNYIWQVGLESWGQAHTQHDGQICAVFIKRNGDWIGGKFDWVSTSRSMRELHHLETYNNWPQSGITLPLAKGTEVAFVVVYRDGSKRSNVVYTKVQ